MPFLLLIQDSGAEERFPCRGELMLVGRDAETAIRLPHESVSRFHARLIAEAEDRWVIEDLGSSNGTFVNGMRVTGRVPLGHGDSLRFGTQALSFQDPLTAFAPGPGEANPEVSTGSGSRRLPLLLMIATAVALTSAAWMAVLLFGESGGANDEGAGIGESDVISEGSGAPEAGDPPRSPPDREEPASPEDALPAVPTDDLPPIPVAGGHSATGRIVPGDAPAPKDRVELAGGRTLIGRLLEDGEEDPRFLRMEVRGEVREIPREEIRAINDRDEAPDWAALFAAHRSRARDVPALEALLAWCERHDRKSERLEVARALVKLAPDHAAARRLLGGVHYRGEWLDAETARTRGLLGPDGILDGTPEDLTRIRRLHLDLLRRSPTPAECVAALGREPEALVTDLLNRSEFHASWCLEQARRLGLPPDLFAPGGLLEKLPKSLGKKGSDFQEATRALISSKAFAALCPDAESFVRRTFRRLLGFGEVIDPRLLGAAIEMVEGQRRAIFGQRGEGREDFIDIILAQPRFYGRILLQDVMRLRGVPLSRTELRRGALRLASNPSSLATMRREWLASSAWKNALKTRRPKTREQLLGSVYPDFFGRQARPEELARLDRALPPTVETQAVGLRLAELLAPVSTADRSDPPRSVHRWCIRLLGRPPQPAEASRLEACWSDPAAGPTAVVFALASSGGWLSY